MEIRKLIYDLRQKAEISPHQGLLLEAANKIEWLQSIVDDMTNDHLVDTLDFYSEQCQELTEKIGELQSATRIDKSTFCKVLSELKRENEFIDSLNSLFHDYQKDNQVYSTSLTNTVVKLLEALFRDEENQWMAYWMWELDFGERYEEGDVQDADGTVISLRTAEELYDFLLKNMEVNDEL